MAVADAQGKLLEAGLTAACLHAAIKAHSCYRHTAEELVNRVNETLWTASAGDQFASLFYALIQPESGQVEHASAGAMCGVHVGQTAQILGSDENPPLGTQPDGLYLARRELLRRGDILLVYSEGMQKALLSDGAGRFGDWVLSHRDHSADSLIEEVRGYIDSTAGGESAEDRTLLVVKRSPAPV